MRTVQMEYLRPGEIMAEKERCSIVYLPIGPLEWHGPAMPYGTDPLMAQELARAAARITGGVVMPTLFVGTERERPAYILEAKGFEDPGQYVIGMDVPNNSMKSFYAREDMFAIIVREHLRLLVQQEYKLIVIVNGHGAWGQKGTLERLATEFTNETTSKVIVTMPDPLEEGETFDFGHGTQMETAIMRGLFDEHVELGDLPPREVPLRYVDYGIADDFVFEGKRSEGDAVKYDPRDATVEQGLKFVTTAINHLVSFVNDAYAAL